MSDSKISIEREADGTISYSFEGSGAEVYALAVDVSKHAVEKLGDGIPPLVQMAIEYRRDILKNLTDKVADTIRKRDQNDPNGII